MSQNPNESPRYDSIDDGSAGELVYYCAFNTRLSVAECRRISKSSFEFVLAVGAKFLGIRLPLGFAFADASQFPRIAPQQLSD